MNNLVQRQDGTYYDDRLGILVDEMYSFAKDHALRLQPDYLHVPSWVFTVEHADIMRVIEIQILEGGAYDQLYIGSFAYRDDEASRTRYAMRKLLRTFSLFLPLDPSLLRETLELARRDALSFTNADLTDTGPLSQPP